MVQFLSQNTKVCCECFCLTTVFLHLLNVVLVFDLMKKLFGGRVVVVGNEKFAGKPYHFSRSDGFFKERWFSPCS